MIARTGRTIGRTARTVIWSLLPGVEVVVSFVELFDGAASMPFMPLTALTVWLLGISSLLAIVENLIAKLGW